MTTGVLYVSTTGVLDPLGRSQVLNYVLALARHRPLHLLTFERPAALRDRGAVDEVAMLCAAAGVTWHRHVYQRGALLAGAYTATQIARRHRLGIVHCRSYIAGAMGLAVQAGARARLIFDMRGFWPDERVEAGVWQSRSLLARAARMLERGLLARADHVVSLTRSGAVALRDRVPDPDRLPPISVIPTCTDLAQFRPSPAPTGPFVLGYVGSIGSWYLFDEVARAVAVLFQTDPVARFRIVTRSDHGDAERRLRAQGVNMARVDLLAVRHQDVPREIACMSAGIFLIAPNGAKRASCPTRMGEFLASGRPILANRGVGDVAQDLSETGTGVTLRCGAGHRPEPRMFKQALTALQNMAADPTTPRRCRAAAEVRFALETGVARYESIYRSFQDDRAPHARPHPLEVP